MTWLLLAVCCALFVELFARLEPVGRARETSALVRKAASVIASRRISDHWKECVLPRYARRMLVSSLSMFAMLLLALSPFAVAGVIAGRLDVPFPELLASFKGIAASCIFAIAYTGARSRILSEQRSGS